MIKIIPKPNGVGFQPVMVCDRCQLQIFEPYAFKLYVRRDGAQVLSLHPNCGNLLVEDCACNTWEQFPALDLFMAPDYLEDVPPTATDKANN